MTRRLATLTEANGWVHLSPESFMRLFSYVITNWHTEGVLHWTATIN